jgi:cysteine synthase
LVTTGDADFSISVGLICAIRDYKSFAFVPPAVSPARKELLKLYGVKVSLIPEIHGQDTTHRNQMYSDLASELCKSLPGSVNISEFLQNEVISPVAEQFVSDIQAAFPKNHSPPGIFVGLQDGMGLLDKIGENMLRWNPECKLVKLDPAKATEKNAFVMARKLIGQEGIWCGPGSGAVLAGAVEFLQKDEEVIVLLMDQSLHSSEKDFLCNDWMLEKGFYNQVDINKLKWWDGISLNNLRLKPVPLLKDETCSVQDALELLEKSDKAPFGLLVNLENSRSGEECIQGILVKDSLTLDGEKDLKAAVGGKILRNFGRIQSKATLGQLEKVLEKHALAVVYKKVFKAKEGEIDDLQEIHVPCGIAQEADILEWVAEVMDHHRTQSKWGIEKSTVFDEIKHVA